MKNYLFLNLIFFRQLFLYKMPCFHPSPKVFHNRLVNVASSCQDFMPTNSWRLFGNHQTFFIVNNHANGTYSYVACMKPQSC